MQQLIERNDVLDRLLKFVKVTEEDKAAMREMVERTKTFVVVQMPCGCPVGSHPSGPCGLTGLGQVA